MVRARRRDEEGGSASSNPSVRQVCLVGHWAGAPGWTAGEPVEWAGRAYRVAAVQGGPGSPVHYALLEPEPEPAACVAWA